jgi:hypothetical protein|tara:strand:- start:703 stop:909 length:207 start_codon:yes stop_codon:yes gene_type:complete
MTKEELAIVVKWLEDRHQYLHRQNLIIEYGDDAPLTNGKGGLLDEIDRERWATKISLNTAKDQLDEAN